MTSSAAQTAGLPNSHAPAGELDLVHLVIRSGKELWSAETFVDFEHSLNTAVKEIRATLGDSPLTPRYIETLPRLGYRFIAPVEVVNGISESAPSPAPSTSNFSTSHFANRELHL